MPFWKYCKIWDKNRISWCCLLSLNWRNAVLKMVGWIYLTLQMWQKINGLQEQNQVEWQWCPKMLVMWQVQVKPPTNELLIWQFSNTEQWKRIKITVICFSSFFKGSAGFMKTMLYIDQIQVDWTPPLILKKPASNMQQKFVVVSLSCLKRYLKMIVLMML